jgi:hypothetical protein
MVAPILEQDRCSLAAELLLRHRTLKLKAFGTSMLPTLWPGDVVTIRTCSFDEACPGDIVLCVRDGRFYLHRVHQKTTATSYPQLCTRGDSMPLPDPPVSRSEILGKACSIERNGRFVELSRSRSFGALFLGRLVAHSNLFLRLVLHLRRTRSSRREFVTIAASV